MYVLLTARLNDRLSASGVCSSSHEGLKRPTRELIWVPNEYLKATFFRRKLSTESWASHPWSSYLGSSHTSTPLSIASISWIMSLYVLSYITFMLRSDCWENNCIPRLVHDGPVSVLLISVTVNHCTYFGCLLCAHVSDGPDNILPKMSVTIMKDWRPVLQTGERKEKSHLLVYQTRTR